MDATRLKYFTTVAQAGSLRAASELLHLSPAALSKAIKLLEYEVGVPLLAPAGRGVMLTDRGRELARKASPLLETLERLSDDLRADRETEVPVRIGSFEVFTTYFAGVLAKDFLPGVPLLVRELVPGEMERAVENHEVDLAITYVPIPSPHLDFLKVTALEMGLYSKSGQFKGVAFQELPFAIPAHPVQGSPNRVKGLDGWPEDKVPRFVRYRVDMMETAMELCRQGLAAAYLPRFVVELHNRTARPEFCLQPMPLPPKLTDTKHAVYLIKRKTDLESPTTRKLAKALRVLCRPSV
ncbi:MAG: LysR family transcriptional regulator [Bdellovibrionales bacterium]|nr:LysR family transcriptional regulator [Bdellovibrionales bacterium]